MVDEPLERCQINGCNGKVKRLVSAGAGIIFKGSGFYETDYKKKSGDSKARGENKPSGEKKKESKPAGKTESAPAAKSGSGSKAKTGESKGG